MAMRMADMWVDLMAVKRVYYLAVTMAAMSADQMVDLMVAI